MIRENIMIFKLQQVNFNAEDNFIHLHITGCRKREDRGVKGPTSNLLHFTSGDRLLYKTKKNLTLTEASDLNYCTSFIA